MSKSISRVKEASEKSGRTTVEPLRRESTDDRLISHAKQVCELEAETMIHENVEAYDFFITDSYHFETIQKFMKEELCLIEKRKIIIIEDCLKNMDKINPDSFVLLYNLSLYIEDSSIFNFYKDLSMLRLQPPYGLDKEKVDNNFSNSYEYNLSKDWDSFYRDYILG